MTNLLFDAPDITIGNLVLCWLGSTLIDFDNPKALWQSSLRHVFHFLFRRDLDLSRWLTHRSSTHSLSFAVLLFLGIYLVWPAALAPFAIGWMAHWLADCHSGGGCRALGHIWVRGSTRISSGSKQEAVLTLFAAAPILLMAFVVVPAGGSRAFALRVVGTPAAALEHVQTAPEHGWEIQVRKPLLRVGMTPAHKDGGVSTTGAPSTVLGFPIGAPKLLSAEPAIPVGKYRFVSSLDDYRFVVRDENGVAHVLGDDATILATAHVTAHKGKPVQTHRLDVTLQQCAVAALVKALGVLEVHGATHFMNGELALDQDVVIPSPAVGFATVRSERRKLTLVYAEVGDLERILELVPRLGAGLVESGELSITIRTDKHDTTTASGIMQALGSLAGGRGQTTSPLLDGNGSPPLPSTIPVEFTVKARDVASLKLYEGKRVSKGELLAQTPLFDDERALVLSEVEQLLETEAAIESAIAETMRTRTAEVDALAKKADDLEMRVGELKELAKQPEDDDEVARRCERLGLKVHGEWQEQAEEQLRLKAQAVLNGGGLEKDLLETRLRLEQVKRTKAERMAELEGELGEVVAKRTLLNSRLDFLARAAIVFAPASGVVTGLRVNVDGDVVVVRFFLVREDE